MVGYGWVGGRGCVYGAWGLPVRIFRRSVAMALNAFVACAHGMVQVPCVCLLLWPPWLWCGSARIHDVIHDV